MKFQITFLSPLLFPVCGVQSGATLPPAATTSAPPASRQVFTPIPTFTAAPQSTTTPLFQLNDNGGTIVFDFTTRLDEFRASLACRTNSNVEFTFTHYDANGKYQKLFPIEYNRQAAEPPINIVWPVNGLDGQTVWISPRIVR